MNEEEKKAVERFKHCSRYFVLDKESSKTILNLIEKMKNCIHILDDELKERNKTINEKEIIIEKLQKENEELKNIELKSKGGAIKISLDGSLSLENKIKQLEKENKELKELMVHKNGYTKLLEEDLFENCENFVISKDRIKEQIKRYAKLSDDCYNEWKEFSPFDEDYKNIRDKGMCCDAIVNALQELLKG